MALQRRNFLLFLGLLALAAIAALAFWLAFSRSSQVETIEASVGPAERVLAVNGRVRPRLRAELRSPLAGQIVALRHEIGERVSKGAELARIDDEPERAAIAEAQAALAAQRPALVQAQRDLARFEALGQFVSRRQVEQQRLAVAQAEREVERLQAALRRAREQRERRILLAPFSGVITDRPVDPGQTVGPETVIYRLADLASPQILAEVDEAYALQLREGMAARVEAGGRPSRARIINIAPRVDPATGAREVRLAFDGAAPDLPEGQTVTVNLLIDRRDKAVTIPRSAILSLEGRSIVRILGEGGLVEDRRIAFIDWPAETVIVTSGLKGGERLLLDPLAARPGERVKPRDMQR